MEDSIDNTQAKEGTMQQKMNFSQPSLPTEQHHAHKDVSFSQSVISEILQQSTSKQSVLSNVSKYIKMKSTEINVDLTDEQLENLKECKYPTPLNILPYSPDISREKEYNKHNTVGA